MLVSHPPPATRLVLDTNIVMDMLHFGDPRTQPILASLARGRACCFTDADCLAELERVTGYPEFRLDAAARAALLARYLALATRCDAPPDENERDYGLPRCRDTDDQKFLTLAARCSADLLVTRDKLLLRLARHRHRPPPYAILTAEAARPRLEAP